MVVCFLLAGLIHRSGRIGIGSFNQDEQTIVTAVSYALSACIQLLTCSVENLFGFADDLEPGRLVDDGYAERRGFG